MSTANDEAERFDTLIAPSGTVATLNEISRSCGVDAMSFDGAYPDADQVKAAIFYEVDSVLRSNEKPVTLFSLLVYNAAESIEVIRDLKREFGNRVKTVVGGQLTPFATHAYASNPDIDSTCLGDGEVIIPKIVRDMQKGMLQPSYSEWLSTQLDYTKRGQFSFVSFDDFYQIRERLEEQKRVTGFSQLCIQGLGGPGCSWAANNKNGACDFCALQNIEEMNRRTLPELMRAERKLEDEFAPDRLFDVANQFLPYLNKQKNIEWLQKYIEERKRQGLKAKKYVYLTVGSIDEDIAPLLKKAGVEEVYLGVDHFHPNSLKEENKSHRSNSRLQRTLDALVRNGITFRIGVVLGSASETPETLQAVREGVTWLKENYREHLTSLGVFPVYILPGSGVYERVRRMGSVQKIIRSFESKGFFTEEEEVALTRAYIERHSEVDADEIFEVSSQLQQMVSTDAITYDYRVSPGPEQLKK